MRSDFKILIGSALIEWVVFVAMLALIGGGISFVEHRFEATNEDYKSAYTAAAVSPSAKKYIDQQIVRSGRLTMYQAHEAARLAEREDAFKKAIVHVSKK